VAWSEDHAEAHVVINVVAALPLHEWLDGNDRQPNGGAPYFTAQASWLVV
jgi:hypothetical protein